MINKTKEQWIAQALKEAGSEVGAGHIAELILNQDHSEKLRLINEAISTGKKLVFFYTGRERKVDVDHVTTDENVMTWVDMKKEETPKLYSVKKMSGIEIC